jgi:hypothetical protein
VNGGHLSREHRLDLIPQLDVFDDGKHEIECAVVDLAVLPIQGGQLLEKAVEEIIVCRPEGLGEERVTDQLVRMIWGDGYLICSIFQHLHSWRRLGSSPSAKMLLYSKEKRCRQATSLELGRYFEPPASGSCRFGFIRVEFSISGWRGPKDKPLATVRIWQIVPCKRAAVR